MKTNTEKLEEQVETLEKIVKAYHFILPEPHKEIQNCVTNTELYRIQHKLTLDLYKQYLNKKQK